MLSLGEGQIKDRCSICKPFKEEDAGDEILLFEIAPVRAGHVPRSIGLYTIDISYGHGASVESDTDNDIISTHHLHAIGILDRISPALPFCS